ncbi:phosphonate ABC transporter, permease protein PhnE [Spiribacter sp. C176]|uniref:Phosphonate ABC transporter, permease protein PhnE n=1 Tax=Spiribacter salilacus TaxID=2664894 RepID=A0A6N7QUB2_9GAMM|nr:phosphonate ABC transporter, permease protein PhnE [Spiribacter salilacus]MRH77917.1 phosphonate ABC transporter, permease protein PhnE [Spiribacter salilacus]
MSAAALQQAEQLIERKRWMSLGLPSLILAYLIYVAFALDVPGVFERADPNNAKTLVNDSFTYKTHVTANYRRDERVVAIEGERKGLWPPGEYPEWVEPVGELGAIVTLPDGHIVEINDQKMRYDVPGYGLIEAESSRQGVTLSLPPGPQPEWISSSPARVSITTDSGRVIVTKAFTEVFRYSFGWELFWFTLDSPFYGKSAAELFGLAFSSERVVPEKPNAIAMLNDFWYNGMWRHGDVFWALFETLLMAFLGTMGAAIIAFSLCFIAAKNFTPLQPLRLLVRRIFDFLRGVDALIWTIVLSRAFGPGPLTGALAILLTDAGSFGKMFSEALENVDNRQIEGVKSTGADAIQRSRFGVIPQVAPVFISQILYYLESNTRSATVIGAITGGGIGLLLTQAIITQKDWEEVSYYIVLVVLLVMLMDWLSGVLRRRLIRGE